MTRTRAGTEGRTPAARTRAGAGVAAVLAAGMVVAAGAPAEAAAQAEVAPASTTAVTAAPDVAAVAPATTPASPAVPVPTTSTLAVPPAPAAPVAPAAPGRDDAAGAATLQDDTVGSDAGGVGREEAGRARRARERREARAALARRHARAAARRKAERAEAKEREEDAREQAAEDARAAAAATPDGGGTTSGPVAPGLGDDAALGAVPAAIPGLFIARFRIPPFLLPIYQAAGVEYGVRWEVLAAINEIETDYGRNLNVSTAGALGWMQFMPATWKAYGVDADGDGTADPMNPVDAIFAAARYLKAAGAEQDIRRAVFAYNHAGWYVDSVMLRARLIGGLPDPLVGSLTGLTQARLPVEGAAPEGAGAAAQAGDPAGAREDAAGSGATGGDAAGARTADATRTDAAVGADPDAPEWSPRPGDPRAAQLAAVPGTEVVAVQDGTIVGTGRNATMGRWIRLRDVFGNRYTYSHLGAVEDTYAVPVAAATDEEAGRRPAKDPVPTAPATAGLPGPAPAATPAPTVASDAARTSAAGPRVAPRAPLFAHPGRAGSAAGRVFGDLAAQDPSATPVGPATPAAPRSRVTRDAQGGRVVVRPLRRGSRVTGGTVLGTIGRAPAAKATRSGTTDRAVPTGRITATAGATDRATMAFSVRPAGRGAPRIDPRPILDGWRLLSATTPKAATTKSALFGTNASAATAGQVLLLPKERLQVLVLEDDRLDIPEMGRAQIRAGAIDRRVLATLAYLSANGHRVRVSSLRRPGAITSSGNVSEHDSGNAVDIAAVDGITITPGTQGPGSVTDRTIRLLLRLQGAMTPHQIISLMTPGDFGGAANVLAMGDHDDHIHVGFRTSGGDGAVLGRQLASALKPAQWDDLIDRLREIDNPEVSPKASPYAVKVRRARRP
jgi:hypothetical protein